MNRTRQRRRHVSSSLSTIKTTLLFFLTICCCCCSGSHYNPLTIGIRSAIARTSSNAILNGPLVRSSSLSSQRRQHGVSSIHRGGGATSIGGGMQTRRRGYKTQKKEEDGNYGVYDADAYNQHISLCSSKSTTPRVATAATTTSTSITTTTAATRGGGGVSEELGVRSLFFWESMICGAISRSIAQTIMHPANTMKTMLQSSRSSAAGTLSIATLARPKNFKLLTRGAGAQFLLSVPHGAVNFAVLEYVRNRIHWLVHTSGYLGNKFQSEAWGPGLDFFSSAISTVCCSVVSTPQMMIVDNIMAGTYPNLPSAVKGLAAKKGVLGFYGGWWPGLAGKIPSYGMTWAFFQQLKKAQLRIMQRPPKDVENSIMGCMASATTVCLMIPMDTIKTRLVTQLNYPDLVPYNGIVDAAVRIFKEEGIGAFYRGLPPRLVSVVPMIGIQFGVYEFMKKVMLQRDMKNGDDGNAGTQKKKKGKIELSPEARAAKNAKKTFMSTERALEEIAMEVAADDEQPFPAPHFRHSYTKKNKLGKKKK
mmetsp:Transcript_11467/g.16891  ORF Transcript_11467/g.16891 Transcript_11467/m.16891 type:complete len:534 (+) Transcript_11467:174-1775(+)